MFNLLSAKRALSCFPLIFSLMFSIFVYINVRKAKNTAPLSPLPPAR